MAQKKNMMRSHNKNRQVSKDLQKSDQINAQIDQIVENHLQNWMVPTPFDEDMTYLAPDIDVVDTPKAVKITAELPGMDPQDVDVMVSMDGYLTISGEKREERSDEENGFYYAERSYGQVSRTVPLPTHIDPENVTATFDKGILHITVPKMEQQKSRTRKVKVK